MARVKYEEMFSGWLPAMRDDQSLYDSDPVSMSPVQLRDHITQLGLALGDEVHELIAEFQWKYWKTINMETFPVKTDRQRVIDEAVDVLHFLAHLLNIVNATEDEINGAMYTKRLENERRQNDGYDY